MTQEAGKSNEETAENIGYIIQAKNVLFRLSIAINDEGEKINYPEYLKDEIQAAIANLDLLVEKKKIASQQIEQSWVKVEAALPERATPVICYWGLGSFQDEGDMTIEDLVDDKGDRLERTWPVTHWKPLPPAPPKQD